MDQDKHDHQRNTRQQQHTHKKPTPHQTQKKIQKNINTPYITPKITYHNITTPIQHSYNNLKQTVKHTQYTPHKIHINQAWPTGLAQKQINKLRTNNLACKIKHPRHTQKEIIKNPSPTTNQDPHTTIIKKDNLRHLTYKKRKNSINQILYPHLPPLTNENKEANHIPRLHTPHLHPPTLTKIKTHQTNKKEMIQKHPLIPKQQNKMKQSRTKNMKTSKHAPTDKTHLKHARPTGLAQKKITKKKNNNNPKIITIQNNNLHKTTTKHTPTTNIIQNNKYTTTNKQSTQHRHKNKPITTFKLHTINPYLININNDKPNTQQRNSKDKQKSSPKTKKQQTKNTTPYSKYIHITTITQNNNKYTKKNTTYKHKSNTTKIIKYTYKHTKSKHTPPHTHHTKNQTNPKNAIT